MAHDLVIRGGMVVDGLGGAPYPADLAIDAGRIAEIGEVSASGRQEIDAGGAIVTPGFVDLHTHYDAQIGWDRLLTPSTWHGVTTALMGNCGMTFAPVRPGEARRLAEMMETVEDIPAEAILSTLPWSWESYGDYLDFVEAQRPAINVAGMIGHCALRYYVMGERAVDGQPDAGEMAQMADIVGQAMAAGAAGLSSSRFLGHMLKDRRHVPGTYAERDELLAMAQALRGGGLFQAVLNGFELDRDMDLMTQIGVATGGPVLVTAVAVEPPAPGRPQVRQPTPPDLERALANGADVTATLLPREGGSLCGLFARLPWRTPAWQALAALPHPERLAAIRTPATRRALVEEAADARAAGPLGLIFFMGEDVARYMQGPEHSLAGLAQAAGEQPAETFLRMASESDGRAMFAVVSFNKDPERLRELLQSERMLPGLGDAGAHLAGVMDASYSTFTLSHWARDAGALSVPEAVRRLTSAPADLLGLPDRGRLSVGAAADINVIDLDRLAALAVETVYDAPLGAPRLIQRARGYRATLVNGVPILLDDEHTGAHAGGVIRSFAGARTAAALS